MKSFILKLLAFCSPIFFVPIFEGAYKVFIGGEIDKKFSSPWTAFEVWILSSLLGMLFLGFTFSLLYFFSVRVFKINLTISLCLILGLAVVIFTYILGFIKVRILGSFYDAVDIGNLLLFLFFIALLFRNRFRKIKS